MYHLQRIWARCIWVLVVMASLAPLSCWARPETGLDYHSEKTDNHILHILLIDPTRYPLAVVKAHSRVFGRETVPEIALRKNAIAAINGGFFEIGKNEDGRPSGSLMIDDQIVALRSGKRDLLVLEPKKIEIEEAALELQLTANGKNIKVDQLNQFAKTDDIVLYNAYWGVTTLTPYQRQEWILDENYKVINVVPHGDNPIPQKGWVLSAPISHPLPSLTKGTQLKLSLLPVNRTASLISVLKNAKSFVMGIPMVVDKGKPLIERSQSSNKKFAEAHARTAIGYQQDGTVVILVAEQAYTQPLKDMKLGQMRAILKSHGLSEVELAVLTLAEAQALLEKHLSSRPGILGLSLMELAEKMAALGCVKAINLDGGGSSTLYYNGKVVNRAFGDNDELAGLEVIRPVSDAIVVLKPEVPIK